MPVFSCIFCDVPGVCPCASRYIKDPDVVAEALARVWPLLSAAVERAAGVRCKPLCALLWRGRGAMMPLSSLL